MENVYCLNLSIVDCLWITLKLTARDNRFGKIQSILVNTNIEKPPDFLGGLIGGCSIYCYKHNLLQLRTGGSKFSHESHSYQ